MEAIKVMELKIASLNTKYIYLIRYQELKDLFEKRPPREKDMDLIFKLREDLIGKDKKLKEAEENMEVFKNELINREELYNKYFGNNPKTGFLNPLKSKETNKDSNPVSQKVLYYYFRKVRKMYMHRIRVIRLIKSNLYFLPY